MSKEYDFYDQIKDWDFSKFEIKSENLTNWDFFEEIRKRANKDSRILDLGTGGGEKVLEHYPDCEILATDFSSAMIETANKNLRKSGRNNITFRVMDNLHMDVPEESFDIVTARNTVIDPKQIYRALKPGGFLLIHGVDKYDCFDLKREFGRGQAVADKEPISVIDYRTVLDAGFNDTELVPLHQREFFKNRELLKAFLLKVPIIDDFSEEDKDFKDYYKKELEDDKLDSYIAKNIYPQGIRLVRRYYGINARKQK